MGQTSRVNAHSSSARLTGLPTDRSRIRGSRPQSIARMSTLAFSLLLVGACSPGSRPQAPAGAKAGGIEGLIDSLVQVGHCPRSDLPPIRGSSAPTMHFDSLQTCGIASAALRRLGAGPAVEPFYAPGDTLRVAGIRIFLMAWQPIDSIAGPAGIPDSVINVELDIPGRPELVAVYLRATGPAVERVEIGTVHR